MGGVALQHWDVSVHEFVFFHPTYIMIAVFLTAGSCLSQPTAVSVHFVYILHRTSENVEYLPEGGREGAYVSICELSWETSSEGQTECACVSMCV